MIVVIDTSVLVSAAILNGIVTDSAVRKALTEHNVIRSVPVMEELVVTLSKKKFKKYFRNEYECDIFIHRFAKQSKLIGVSFKVTVCRNSTDNKFLELALSGKANCIVTGDPDRLVLHPFENILIITPKEF